MNRPVMGSEYDVPYVHGLIDAIERAEERVTRLREGIEDFLLWESGLSGEYREQALRKLADLAAESA